MRVGLGELERPSAEHGIGTLSEFNKPVAGIDNTESQQKQHGNARGAALFWMRVQPSSRGMGALAPVQLQIISLGSLSERY
jgi:hypothetical protein